MAIILLNSGLNYSKLGNLRFRADVSDQTKTSKGRKDQKKFKLSQTKTGVDFKKLLSAKLSKEQSEPVQKFDVQLHGLNSGVKLTEYNVD